MIAPQRPPTPVNGLNWGQHRLFSLRFSLEVKNHFTLSSNPCTICIVSEKIQFFAFDSRAMFCRTDELVSIKNYHGRHVQTVPVTAEAKINMQAALKKQKSLN